ncbi:MAG: Ig-like domain-containing protein [Chromatiales bacterium]|nr:Ig-like domain-containing protein [Chromatiales bacterium]
MKPKAFTLKRINVAILLLAGTSLAPAAARAVDLMAAETTWNSPDGPVTMWGFFNDTGDCATVPGAWTTAPVLTGTPGSSLTINLRNCLAEPVSIIIPGQPTTFTPEYSAPDAQGRRRVTSFTHATAANGGTGVYTWSNLNSGTFLYQSGAHPAKQIHMGLYGALKVGTYANTSEEVTLLFSEVDPSLHNPPAAANPLNYTPKYFLINGQIAPTITAGDTLAPTALRMLNAGLDSRVPALNSGYMAVVGEDGNAYPYPRQQYSAHLPAGKTVDALWQPTEAGDHKIVDRMLSGAMLTLAVSPGGDAPAAADDAYTTDEETTLNVTAPGVLANDDPDVTAQLTTDPANGVVTLNADGSFDYTPNTNFFGDDSFQYKVNDGVYDSVQPATVTITVNNLPDAPIAVADTYEVGANGVLDVVSPGVLDNDSDPDQQLLTVAQTTPLNPLVTLSPDGAFTYAAGVIGTDSFIYELYEDGVASGVTARVDINIVSPNTAPVATDNSYTTVTDTAVTGNVISDDTGMGIDSDAEGDALTIAGNTEPTSGQLTIDMQGAFSYTPNIGFTGADSFEYTLSDGNGGTDLAVVDITVSGNSAPVAVEDYPASITWNSLASFINIVANDTDVDNNLANPSGDVTADRITLTTGSQTTRRGSVAVVDNGVLYTPRTNFRGTDTFNYTVTDLAGETSNEVTVRINVIRP